MPDLPEAEREFLRDLARTVSLHRRAGGVLDGLPSEVRQILQAMSREDRLVFMEELAGMDADAAKGKFREKLGGWRTREPGPSEAP